MSARRFVTGLLSMVAALVPVTARAVTCVAGPATGTVYYACDCGTGAQPNCTPGNDANPGTSPSQALRTLDAVISKWATMVDGDRMELCYGGVFQESVSTNSFNNTHFTAAGGGGVVMPYSAAWGGGTVLPVLLIPSGQDGIRIVSPSAVMGPMLFADLEIAGQGNSGVSAQAFGIFVYGNSTGIVGCELTIHDMQIGMSVSRNVETDRNLNSMLEYSIVHDCWGQGWLGGDTGTVILNTVFYKDGTRQNLDHDIYLVGANGSDPTQPSVGMTVQGCNLTQTSWTALTGCQAAELVSHGLWINGSFIGNYIHEVIGTIDPGCWGIALAPGYVTAEQMTNVLVDSNRIENVGNASIVAGSWNGGTIQNNAIVNKQGVNDLAIDVPDDENPEDAKTTNVIVRSNSLLLDGGTAVKLGTEGTGHGSNDNAIYMTTAGTCFLYNLPSASYGAGIDRNDCFIVGGTGNHWQASQSITAWRTSSGFDTNSIISDPAYLSMTLPYNLAILGTSPLAAAGSAATAAPLDINGNTRPNPPSIGAYEPATASNAVLLAYLRWGVVLLFLGMGAIAVQGVRRRKQKRLADPHGLKQLAATIDRFQDVARRVEAYPDTDD